MSDLNDRKVRIMREEDYEIDKKAWKLLEEMVNEAGLKLVPSERTRKNLLERKTNGNIYE